MIAGPQPFAVLPCESQRFLDRFLAAVQQELAEQLQQAVGGVLLILDGKARLAEHGPVLFCRQQRGSRVLILQE